MTIAIDLGRKATKQNNKLGLVTYIQVNVYIGNKLLWLNSGAVAEHSKLTYVEE